VTVHERIFSEILKKRSVAEIELIFAEQLFWTSKLNLKLQRYSII